VFSFDRAAALTFALVLALASVLRGTSLITGRCSRGRSSRLTRLITALGRLSLALLSLSLLRAGRAAGCAREEHSGDGRSNEWIPLFHSVS
jgi:hypothetical protein